jgi:toxin ParE1/3/4
MKIIVTPAAEAELLEIGLWIAEDDPVRAQSFMDELRQVCSRLTDAPRAYPLIERYKRSGIRRRIYRDYLIFYRVALEQIDILHILHGARDYEVILAQELE